MNLSLRSTTGGRLASCLVALIFSLGGLFETQAQPMIVSTVPLNGASGVSPTAPVVFTFSEAMNTNTSITSVDFLDLVTFLSLPTTPAWSAGNTVLTCTPTPAFPTNRMILWSVTGENPGGIPLGGSSSSFFTTGSAGGGGGSGSNTNRITMFSLGKLYFFNQTSTAAPAPDTSAPYNFIANTTLASNRTATAVNLTLPNSAVSNLTENFLASEQFFLFFSSTNQTTFSNTWPDGNYTFTVISNASSQMVAVSLPATMVQPNAPHTTSYTAAQAVNPTQPFTLGWDTFQGGTSTDIVYVAIGTAFATTNAGQVGALNGTATSVVIPAGTLQPNSNYLASISFYRAIFNTNNPTYSTFAYRVSMTQFSLISTGGGSNGPLILTNAARAGGIFSFDITSAIGQTFTVQDTTNLAGLWQTLLTTNSPAGRVHISDSRPMTNRALFYRARNGS
jgi:hypothetical protein